MNIMSKLCFCIVHSHYYRYSLEWITKIGSQTSNDLLFKNKLIWTIMDTIRSIDRIILKWKYDKWIIFTAIKNVSIALGYAVLE